MGFMKKYQTEFNLKVIKSFVAGAPVSFDRCDQHARRWTQKTQPLELALVGWICQTALHPPLHPAASILKCNSNTDN